MEHQDSSFLNSKLRWLDCVPKILKAAERESNPNTVHWLQQRSNTSDEGLLLTISEFLCYSFALKYCILSRYIGSDALLLAIILSYLLHDPQTKQDHSRIVQIVPVSLVHAMAHSLPLLSSFNVPQI